MQFKFTVYGRDVVITRTERGWSAFYSGVDGKRRPAEDITIPSEVDERGLQQYLADLCHEWATETNPDVERSG